MAEDGDLRHHRRTRALGVARLDPVEAQDVAPDGDLLAGAHHAAPRGARRRGEHAHEQDCHTEVGDQPADLPPPSPPHPHLGRGQRDR